MEACTATISADTSGAALMALSAAACTWALIVVCTGWPALPRHCCRTATCAPLAFSATTSVVGEPASSRW